MLRDVDTRYLLCPNCLRIRWNPFSVQPGSFAGSGSFINCKVQCPCGRMLAAPDIFASGGSVNVANPGDVASAVIERLLSIARAAAKPGADLEELAQSVNETIPSQCRDLVSAHLSGLTELAKGKKGAAFLVLLRVLILTMLFSWATGTPVKLDLPLGFNLEIGGDASELNGAEQARIEAIIELYNHLRSEIKSLQPSKPNASKEELDRINEKTQFLLQRIQ